MKKVNIFLGFTFIAFIFSFIGIINVKAVNLIPSASTVNVGKSITLKIDDVVSGNEYSFSFVDEGYFEVSSTTCGNRTSITSNCEMKLTAKSSLSLTDDKKVTFKIIEKAENDATKTADVTIVANKPTTTTTKSTSSTTTTTTTTTTVAAKSNNANLKTLSVTDNNNNNKEVMYSPEFSPNVYEYSATVDSTVSSVSVNVTMEDDKSNVVITNPDSLVAGENNKITITVTAEDGITKKAYVLNIKREALDGNAYLSSLEIKEYPELKFKSDQFTYTIKVDDAVDKLTIDYSVTSSSSVVTITDNSDLKDGSKVKILVEAEDGSKREYTLKISKTSEKESTKEEVKETYQTQRNPIIIMLLSIVAFSLLGSIIYVAKK